MHGFRNMREHRLRYFSLRIANLPHFLRSSGHDRNTYVKMQPIRIIVRAADRFCSRAGRRYRKTKPDIGQLRNSGEDVRHRRGPSSELALQRPRHDDRRAQKRCDRRLDGIVQGAAQAGDVRAHMLV